MKNLAVMVVQIVVLAAIPAAAVNRSGNDLLVDCANLVKSESIESVPADNVLGMGYCIGIIDGMVTFNYVYESVLRAGENADLVQMCLPQRISTRELAKVIVKHLENNPGKLHQSGQALAAQALTSAYPCGREPEP
ncbi:MAG: hypothetical protein LJE64_06455 [Desulfofustis sp.]|jgi:hypothetical protein|nr:hypothetical protein [Desulfofustis sp.]